MAFTLPKRLLIEMIGEAAQECGALFDEINPTDNLWLLYEAFGQAMDAGTFGPAVTMPVALAAGVDLLRWLQSLAGESLGKLTAGEHTNLLMRPYRVATEAWDCRVFARSEWMAQYAIYKLWNDRDSQAEEVVLDLQEETDCWGETVRVARILLTHVSDPAQHVVHTEVQTVMLNALIQDQDRWLYDAASDTLVLAAIYGDLPFEEPRVPLADQPF